MKTICRLFSATVIISSVGREDRAANSSALKLSFSKILRKVKLYSITNDTSLGNPRSS